MASCGSRLINRIKRFFTLQSPKKGKGEPTKGKGKPIYGESLLRNAYVDFHKYRQIQKFHQQSMETWTSTSTYVANDCDEPAEVFLDENGDIREPLVRGTAYDFCKLDRWYMPDCVPGIISKVDITNMHPGDLEIQGRARRVITVLHANDKYIHLAPRKVFYIEPDDDYYAMVESHFIRRGIDFIREQNVNSKDWDNWAKTFGTPYGQRSNKTGVTVIGSGGKRHSNTPIVTCWGPDVSSFSCSISEAKNAPGPSWTIGTTGP